jgi:hypothetical protein
VSAKTAWFYCGACGFKNRPRHLANSLGTHPNPSVGHDFTKCEQCGADQGHPDAHDYVPVS